MTVIDSRYNLRQPSKVDNNQQSSRSRAPIRSVDFNISQSRSPRATRSLSPTPSKRPQRGKLSNSEDFESLYFQRLSRGVKAQDNQPFQQVLQPIRPITAIKAKASSSTADVKTSRGRNDRYDNDSDHDYITRNSVRRPINPTIDDNAVLAMEMEAFLKCQQSLSALLARIESLTDAHSVLQSLGLASELLQPIGIFNIFFFSFLNGSLVHVQPDGHNIELDDRISGAIAQAVNAKDLGLFNSQADAIFPAITTVTSNSFHWSDFCLAMNVRDRDGRKDKDTHSWKCIHSISIQTDGRTVAIALAGSGYPAQGSNERMKWQDVLALQMLQQLKLAVEKRLQSIYNSQSLLTQKIEADRMRKKEFVGTQMQSFATALPASFGSARSVLASAIQWSNILVSSLKQEMAQRSEAEESSWVIVETRRGISESVFSVIKCNSSDRNHLSVRQLRFDSKTKGLKPSDLFSGRSTQSKTLRTLNSQEIAKFFYSPFGDDWLHTPSDSRSLACSSFTAPIHISEDNVHVSDSSHETVRCVLCVLVHSSNKELLGEDNDDDEETLLSRHLNDITNFVGSSLSKLQSALSQARQAQLNEVLRIVHRTISYKDSSSPTSKKAAVDMTQLLQLANVLQSEQVANCFGVRRSSLLMSQTFLSKLDFQASFPLEPIDSHDYSEVNRDDNNSAGNVLHVSSRRNSSFFTRSTGSSFQTILSCDADPGTDLWLQELYNGNPVSYSSDNGFSLYFS